MAPVFVIPESGLEELERDSQEDRLCVQRRVDATDDLAREVAFHLGDNEVTCIEEQTLFDQVYSLIKDFGSLQPSIKRMLIESLCSNCTPLIASISSLKWPSGEDADNDPAFLREQIQSQRNALKIYVFFLQQIFTFEESGADSSKGKAPTKSKQPRRKQVPLSWNWEDFRPRIVSLLGRALEADLQQLYGISQPESRLLAFFAKFGLKLLENANIMKDKESKEAICRYLATLSVKYEYTAQLVPSMIDLLHKCEHVPIPLVEVTATSEKMYGDTTLAVGLIREIGITNPGEYSRLPPEAENVKLFLVELADQLPKVVAANMSMLMPHFGGESYKIRNALVTVLGKLIAKAFGDSDGNVSEEIRLRNKQAMLDILVERARDTNAFTRSTVLQTWGYLCEQNALSIGLWNQVVEIAAGRLHDKSVHVRKSALQLLSTLLEYNPFGPQLKTGRFEATLDMYKEQLEKMATVNANGDSTTVQSNNTEHPASENSYTDSQQASQSQGRSDIGGIEQTRALVASLESALRFTKTVASTIPTVGSLLSSPAVFDVQHGIQFLTKCHTFGVDGCEECLRKMLPLVFSQEKTIYEAVEGAFTTTYIKRSPQETATNLLKLLLEASVGDLSSVEAILTSLMKKGDIPAGTISALWDIFTFNAAGVTAEQCRGALAVLCMISKANPIVMNSRIQKVVDIGFGRWAREDILLARFACVALQRIPNEDVSILQSGHKVFSMLASLITGPILPEKSWYSAAEQAITAIYAIHPTPESFMSALIARFSEAIFGSTVVDSTMLSRYFFTAGHVALKHLVYIESCVRTIRKQRSEKERVANGNTEAPEKEENINAELGMAATEDLKLDLLLDKAEKEIISSNETRKFLIGRIAPVVSKLCRNSALLQQFPQLRSSAVLCLCKLMAVDSSYCDENLQLLFTIAQNSREESVRSNCIISLGDIAFRFPNLLEPWTEHIYARLHDKSDHVRKHAVLVIAHLILNDMMKVKGHISEMAIRTEDENCRISDLAKLFFIELSKKASNPIYNLLPDILSRLSCSPNVTRESFQRIMEFLIDFIKKDRQIEGLIEKLCNRFSGTSDGVQWQAIAYCLSQLTYTEKGMKKLMDSFKQFSNALVDEQVLDCFKSICVKAKKLTKQDYRQVVEEFEQKLSECHEQLREEHVEAAKARDKALFKEPLDTNGDEHTSSTVVEGEGEEEFQSRRGTVKDKSSNKSARKPSKAVKQPPASTRKKAQKQRESLSESTCTDGMSSTSVSSIQETESVKAVPHPEDEATSEESCINLQP